MAQITIDQDTNICCKYFQNLEDLFKNLSVFTLRKGGLEGVDRLRIVESKLDGLNSDSLAKFKKLSGLVISSCNLEKVPLGLFAGLPLLQLNLEDNGIEELPKEEMASLDVLNLGNNKVKRLSDGIFSNFSNLREIILRDNKITTITEDAFKGLPNLLVIDLRRNEIRDLHYEAFEHLKGTALWINLDFNMIEEIAPCLFRNLKKIQYISVRNNLCKFVDDFQFLNLDELTELYLDNNQIDFIHDDAFKTVPNLKVLTLGYNKLKGLKHHFVNCEQLEVLDLQHNELEEVPILHTLRKLEHLHLNHNQIQTFEQLHWQCLESLLTLNFKFNRLQQLESEKFKYLKTLRVLNLSYNNLIKIVIGTFDGLKKLTTLNLSHNGLLEIQHGVFKSLPKLKSLNLDVNYLGKEIDVRFFQHLTSLTTFSMQLNDIKKLPTNLFTKMKKLKVLNLNRNRLGVEINGHFDGLDQLQFLYLKRTRVKRLEKLANGKLKNLIFIDLTTWYKPEGGTLEMVINQTEEVENSVLDISPDFFKQVPSLKFFKVNKYKAPSNFVESNKSLLPNLILLNEDVVPYVHVEEYRTVF